MRTTWKNLAEAPMWRTALVAVAAALLSFAAARWLTHDFQVWTAEGARRLEVSLHPLPAPPVPVEGPGLPAQTLEHLLTVDGAVTLVDFMYARCVTVCMALGSTFQRAQAAIATDERGFGEAPLRLLSISFDPQHDDLVALAAYADRFRARGPIWRFARVAQPTDMGRVLHAYGVTVIADGLGGYEHNAALMVVDRAGRLVRIFDYAELDAALAYAHALALATSP